MKYHNITLIQPCSYIYRLGLILWREGLINFCPQPSLVMVIVFTPIVWYLNRKVALLSIGLVCTSGCLPKYTLWPTSPAIKPRPNLILRLKSVTYNCHNHLLIATNHCKVKESIFNNPGKYSKYQGVILTLKRC